MTPEAFEWEKPLVELERRIAELRSFSEEKGIDLSGEIATLEERAVALRQSIYRNLTPWQRVQIARHPRRPTALDYIARIFDDFMELHGDRAFRDDPAVVGGIGFLGGIPVTVVGTQKGRDTKENLARNFGLPHPEGFRKAMRLALQAEKFGRPVVTLIDIVGAYPGIEAEERGQGLVIAESIRTFSVLRTPVVCAVTGEAGSGGALAIGVGDRILMMEYAWHSVISPEGCASILWKDAGRAPEAAAALRLAAEECLRLGVVDEILPEPPGGAHRDPDQAAVVLKEALLRHIEELLPIPPDELVRQRQERYRHHRSRPHWELLSPGQEVSTAEVGERTSGRANE